MGGHGHAMGAPRIGLGGMTRQRHAVGKEAWAPRHAGCLRSDTNSAQACARRCMGSCKAAHRRAWGRARQRKTVQQWHTGACRRRKATHGQRIDSARGSAQTVGRQHPGRACWLHGPSQGGHTTWMQLGRLERPTRAAMGAAPCTQH